MTYPDGEVVTYKYNSSMLLETLSGTANYVTGTTYDAAGRVRTRALGNGLMQGFDYYAWDEKATVDSVLTGQGGRLKTLSAGTLQNLSYLYDVAGNIRTIEDSTTTPNHEIQAFAYDAMNRLESAIVTDGPALYSEGLEILAPRRPRRFPKHQVRVRPFWQRCSERWGNNAR